MLLNKYMSEVVERMNDYEERSKDIPDSYRKRGIEVIIGRIRQELIIMEVLLEHDKTTAGVEKRTEELFKKLEEKFINSNK